MKLSKKELKHLLDTRCFDIEIKYNDKYGSIIPNYDGKNAYSISFEGAYKDVKDIAEAMNINFFDGKCLKDIYKSAEFSY